MSSRITRLIATGIFMCTYAAGTQAQSDSVVAEAASLRQANEPRQAEDLLTSYLKTHPEDPDVLTALAALRIEQGRQDDAATLLSTTLRARPDSIPANQALGDLLLAEHHFPEAMDRYETILAISLSNPAARAGERTAAIQLALDARHAGREDAALACLEHAAQHLPNDPVLLTDFGIEADRLHQLPQAAKALEQALYLAPGDPTALYALARVEIDQQHLPSAEAHLRDYLARKPEDASAHFGLGRLLSMELRTDEATTELRRSIALEPNQTESYYQLGQIELDAHHDAAAQPLFAKVIDRDPKHGGALTGLGILAYRAKNFTTAEHDLALAVESSPDYQPAHYYYGLTLGRLGKTSASQAELKRAAELASNLHAAPVQQIQAP
jgi:tetratricopeptide (TPR) repeat protein